MPFMLTTGKFFCSVVGIKGMNFLPLRQRQHLGGYLWGGNLELKVCTLLYNMFCYT